MLFDIIFHPSANALPGRCPLPKSKLNCFPDLICQLVSWDLFSRMQMWVGVCKWSISHPMMAVLRKNAWSFMLRTPHVTSSAFLWQQSLNGQAIPKRYVPCFCWRIKLIEKGGFKLSWFKSSMDRVFSNQSSPIGLAQLVSHLAQLVSTTPKKNPAGRTGKVIAKFLVQTYGNGTPTLHQMSFWTWTTSSSSWPKSKGIPRRKVGMLSKSP